MRWFGKLFEMRLRLIIRQAVLWILLAIAVLLAFLPWLQYQNQSAKTIPVAVISEDTGPFASVYFDKLSRIPNVSFDVYDDLARAQRGLNAGKYEAILAIKENFSSSIENARTEEVFTLYLTPSSSVAGALGEVFAEQYIEIWIEAYLVNDYQALLEDNKISINEAELQLLRDKMRANAKTSILMELVIHDSDLFDQPAPIDDPITVLSRTVAYYCAIVPFFVILSSRWVIEQRKNSIGLRMKAMGISQVVSITASSLVMLVICLVVLLIPVLSISIALKIAWTQVLFALTSALFYLCAIIGIALILASISATSVNLMLFAPLVVLLNAFLGGLVIDLPQWSIAWQTLSQILPGRMLSLALETRHLTGLLFCAAICFVLGLALVWFLQERQIQS